MATLAIVGAGRGLGAAVARRFGREGFAIALVSRDQTKLDAMAAELADGGVTARGYSADVRDAASLEAALTSAADDPDQPRPRERDHEEPVGESPLVFQRAPFRIVTGARLHRCPPTDRSTRTDQ